MITESSRYTRRIGISGGTFDPVHIGHLISAEYAREKFGLDKVIFIPTGTPPHKDTGSISDSAHRYAMVSSAIAGNPYFEVSDMEISRNGITYTCDTLKLLTSMYEGSKLFFIVGADVLPEIEGWKDLGSVFLLCDFIVSYRPGISKSLVHRYVKRLCDLYGAVMHVAGSPLVNVSSTQIRRLAAEGKSIRYQVPGTVEEYILSNHLYMDSAAE